MGFRSKLQKATGELLYARLSNDYTILENYRPEWLLSSNLTRLELDFFIKEKSIGIEVQGIQHYEYTPYFHESYEGFLEQKKRDKEKKDLCYGHRVRLVEIFSYQDILEFIEKFIETPQRYNPISDFPLKFFLNAQANREEKRKEATQHPKIVQPKKVVHPPKKPYKDIDVIKKYISDRKEFEIRTTTIENKIIEAEKFRRKAKKHADRKRIAYFKFYSLDSNEQDVFLSEFGILEKIEKLFPEFTEMKFKNIIVG